MNSDHLLSFLSCKVDQLRLVEFQLLRKGSCNNLRVMTKLLKGIQRNIGSGFIGSKLDHIGRYQSHIKTNQKL